MEPIELNNFENWESLQKDPCRMIFGRLAGNQVKLVGELNPIRDSDQYQ